MKYGIFVGVTKESVTEFNKAIIAILNTSAGDAVKTTALSTLKEIIPKNTNISYCTINGDK